MAEKRITLENVEPILLFGSNDTHLKKIEAAFPDARITARNNQLILSGMPSTLERVDQTVRELCGVIERSGHLTETDVDVVLGLYAGPPTAAGSVPGAPATVRVSGTGEPVILHAPDGTEVKARTRNQVALLDASERSDVVFAIGPAGTGKTYTAVAIAVAALKLRRVKRIVLSRPAVEAGEQLGFLPGTFRDKVDPYLYPLYDALGDMVPRDKLAVYLEQDTLEIVPLAYMRGRTLDNAFVILDEAQNATEPQMKMFLTRLGTGSRAIVTGDVTQIDLGERSRSGLVQARRVLSGIQGIDFVLFDRNDVVRHRLVKDIIDAYEAHNDASGQAKGRTGRRTAEGRDRRSA